MKNVNFDVYEYIKAIKDDDIDVFLFHGRFFENDVYTTIESNRLVRLPLWYGMKDSEVETVIKTLKQFFGDK